MLKGEHFLINFIKPKVISFLLIIIKFPMIFTLNPWESFNKSYCFNSSETALTLTLFSIRFFIFSDFLCSLNNNFVHVSKRISRLYPNPFSVCFLFYVACTYFKSSETALTLTLFSIRFFIFWDFLGNLNKNFVRVSKRISRLYANPFSVCFLVLTAGTSLTS